MYAIFAMPVNASSCARAFFPEGLPIAFCGRRSGPRISPVFARLAMKRVGSTPELFFPGKFAYNICMQFNLSSALIDDILFHMENQHGKYLFDTREGAVLPVSGMRLEKGDGDMRENGRYVPLPEWGPPEGFRLMGRFTAKLRNAPAREDLSAALDKGKGVFRAFKDALTKYPETEKLWFAYKDSEMRSEVIAWYNALRESWGLELIGEEPEDIAGLALEDFRFRTGTQADAAQAEELHTACMKECASTPDGSITSTDALGEMGRWIFPGDLSLVAETAGGDFAGYASAVRFPDFSLRICAVEVQGEYRGLGLGKSLLTRILEQADTQKIKQTIIDLPAGQDYFARVLLREFFKPHVQRYGRDRPAETG